MDNMVLCKIPGDVSHVILPGALRRCFDCSDGRCVHLADNAPRDDSGRRLGRSTSRFLSQNAPKGASLRARRVATASIVAAECLKRSPKDDLTGVLGA